MSQVKKKSLSEKNGLKFFVYSTAIKCLTFLENIVDKNGKYIYIKKMKKTANVLDVGCGNVTHLYFQILNPQVKYNGVDVKNDYYADTSYYELDNINFVEPAEFTSTIKNEKGQFDYILSIHNIEHCFEPDEIWEALLAKLAIGGELYLRTPSRESVDFPARNGTLNFYDDYTHTKPIVLSDYLKNLDKNRYDVLFFKDPYYGSSVTRFLGKFLEPISKYRNKVLSKITWHYWGFESIIILKRIK
jgi:SAM-dependent methyltransferase